MLKVLIVDDDKLVRKGLIFSMPWSTFDMEVVGEANNGEVALEFLQHQAVDLMMLDLAMPVMSGIELMQRISQRYPQTHIVVLTFHQNFEYIQEALRYGAIDYIVKAELEKDKFEAVLGRISALIKRERQKGIETDSQRRLAADTYPVDEGLALITTDEQPDTRWMQTIDLAVWNPEEIGTRLWLGMAPAGVKLEEMIAGLMNAIEKNGHWVLIRLSGLKGETRSTVHRALRGYRDKVIFYEHTPAQTLIAKTLAEVLPQPPSITEEEMRRIKEHWLALTWVYKATLFEQLLAELNHARMPVSHLVPLMSTVENNLVRLCGAQNPLQINPLAKVTNWYELENWLNALRQQVYQTICGQSCSEGVVQAVFEAIKIVTDELATELTALEIAKRVHLSRSYFSQCFKDITGKSFNDYLRQVRMDRAKEYLLQTNQPIAWVAEQIGYLDEKYFSHVFKLQTGMLPSEYRRNMK